MTTETLCRIDRAELLRDEIALMLGDEGLDLALDETTFTSLVEEVAAEVEAHEKRKVSACR